MSDLYLFSRAKPPKCKNLLPPPHSEFIPIFQKMFEINYKVLEKLCPINYSLNKCVYDVASNSYVHAKQYTKHTLYTSYTVHTTLHTVHTPYVCVGVSTLGTIDHVSTNKIQVDQSTILHGPKHYSSYFQLQSGRVSILEIQRVTVVHSN